MWKILFGTAGGILLVTHPVGFIGTLLGAEAAARTYEGLQGAGSNTLNEWRAIDHEIAKEDFIRGRKLDAAAEKWLERKWLPKEDLLRAKDPVTIRRFFQDLDRYSSMLFPSHGYRYDNLVAFGNYCGISSDDYSFTFTDAIEKFLWRIVWLLVAYNIIAGIALFAKFYIVPLLATIHTYDIVTSLLILSLLPLIAIVVKGW